MTNILFITTSPRGEASLSSQVAQTLLDDLKRAHPGARVVTRDLASAPLPHLGQDLIGGFFTPADSQSPAQKAAVARSDQLIGEVRDADIVVIASAMINFSITSTLKTWIDHITRNGVTFRYTEEGMPQGLLNGKKVYVVLATGGVYSAAPLDAIDFQAPYLRHVLGFIGLSEVDIVRVEGSAFGPEATEKALATAHQTARDAVQQVLAA